MELIKAGATWAAKAWLAIVLVMIAVLFIGGVLSDPGAVFGGGSPSAP